MSTRDAFQRQRLAVREVERRKMRRPARADHRIRPLAPIARPAVDAWVDATFLTQGLRWSV